MEAAVIHVVLGKKHSPVSFIWLERTHRVRCVQECWRLSGAWWDGEGEKTFFRVFTQCGGIYEICFDSAKSCWTMSGVCD